MRPGVIKIELKILIELRHSLILAGVYCSRRQLRIKDSRPQMGKYAETADSYNSTKDKMIDESPDQKQK